MGGLPQRELVFDRLPEPTRGSEHRDALSDVSQAKRKVRQRLIHWAHKKEVNNRFPTDDFWGNVHRLLRRIEAGRCHGPHVFEMKQRACALLMRMKHLRYREVATAVCSILSLGTVEILDSEQPLKNWLPFLPEYASGAKVPRRETVDAPVGSDTNSTSK